MFAAGCAGTARIEPLEVADLAWPLESPRVRLESILSLGEPSRGRAVARWIGGSQGPPLVVRPFGATWDGDDLLVTDAGAGRVLRIASDGRVQSSPAGELSTPIGIARCAQGIVVSDSRAGSVQVLDESLKRSSTLIAELTRPTGVACDADVVYVAETGRHRILQIVPGEPPQPLGERGAGPGQFNFPSAIALGRDDLWIGDTLNFRVQRYATSRREFVDDFGEMGELPGQIARTKGIAIDARGNLWVTDAQVDQVVIYRPDGSFLMDIGTSGNGPAELSFPAGIAAHPDGRVAVVDSLNRRIQIFRALDVPRVPETGGIR